MDEQKLAPMREQVYKDPRPKEYFDRFHERSRTREPDWVYGVVRVLTTLWGFVAFRARCINPEKVPADGAVILAPNHFSFMDHFLLGMFLRRQVRFMAKSQLFDRPMQWVYTHGGVFPVRRGYRDDEAFITAGSILDKGGCLAMYCEGGRSRTGKLSDSAKPGIGRLALESGATVVPVAIYGSAQVRNWKRLQFPKVTVQYGDPLSFERMDEAPRERQQETADAIFAAIRELYSELDRGNGRRDAARGIRAGRRGIG